MLQIRENFHTEGVTNQQTLCSCTLVTYQVTSVKSLS